MRINKALFKLLSYLPKIISNPVFALVLLGVIIRFALIPFTLDEDFLSTLNRATFNTYFNGPISRSLGEFVITGWIHLFRDFFSQLPGILQPDLGTTLSISQSDLTNPAYQNAISSPMIFRYLTLLKIPYLVADLALAFVLYRNFRSKAVLFFWAINPFILFPSFMYGRYEVFAVLAMVLSLVFLFRKKVGLSYLALALAISVRPFFVIFIPFYLIYTYKNKKVLLTCFLALVLYLLLNFSLDRSAVGVISGNRFYEFFIDKKFGGLNAGISVFLLAYCLIAFQFYKEKIQERIDFNRLIFWLSLTTFSFFVFGRFHPPYLAWIAPVSFFLVSINKKVIIPLVLSFVFAALSFEYDAIFACRGNGLCLFDPLNFNFTHTLYSFGDQLSLLRWPGDSMLTVFITLFASSLATVIIIIKDTVYAKK